MDPKRQRIGMLKEVGSMLVQGALFGFGYLPSQHAPERKAHIRTTVLVHGLGGNRASLYPLMWYLRAGGHRRFYSYNQDPGGTIERRAKQLGDKLAEQIKGGRIDLVCHSMGGLVARFWIQRMGGARRVDRLITLGTPHHGSHAAAWIPTELVAQLHPESDFLARLNAEPWPESVQLLSFAAEHDLIVLPPTSALAPHGETHLVPGVGHNGILTSPQVLRRIRRALPLERPGS